MVTRRPRESISARSSSPRRRTSSPRLGGGDVTPVEVGGVGLGDGFAGVFGGDGGDLRDHFAGDGGADGEVAGGGGHAKMGEDVCDFLFDRHDLSGLFSRLSVDGWRYGWQVSGGGAPPPGGWCS